MAEPQLPSIIPDICLDTRLRRQAGVILCHVDGKHMLVPAMTNEVDLECLFLLNSTGVFIWERLDGRRPVRDLGEELALVFEVDVETATADAFSYLSNLFYQNLLELAETHWY